MKQGQRGISTSYAMWLCALALGCSVYDDTLVATNPSCALKHPPDRPAGVDNAADNGELTFVLRDPLLDQAGAAWSSIAYDIDGLCTTADEGEVECLPPDTSNSLESDGSSGVDNAIGQSILPLMFATYADAPQLIAQTVEQGIGALLVRIRGWNGQADDPRVTMESAPTAFGTPAQTDGSAPAVMLPLTESVPPPNWDGKDYFWTRNDGYAMQDESRPLIRDDTAYIEGNVLVAQVPDRSDIAFVDQNRSFVLRITDGTIVGQLSADRSTLDPVVMYGRVAITDFLEAMGRAGFCAGSSEYGILQRSVQRFADVRSKPGSGGEGVTCDALSVAVQFKGVRASWGGLTSGTPLPDACGST